MIAIMQSAIASLFGWRPSGPLQDVAGEIGVTREALYRELARRRRDQSRAPATKAAALRTPVVVT